jgi:hypothetical protein
MSHGREQDETRGTVGKRERVGGRKRSTPGMTDQDRAPDTELLKRLRDKFRLAFRRSVRRIRRPRTPSVAGTVDQNHAIRSCQRLAQRKPHVFHVSARTMDQHDGGLGTWRIPRKTHLGNMQTYTFDFDERSCRRMRGLDPRNAEQGHGSKHAKRNNKRDGGSGE